MQKIVCSSSSSLEEYEKLARVSVADNQHTFCGEM